MYDRFPDLAAKPARLAGSRGGGRRQMLGLARAPMAADEQEERSCKSGKNTREFGWKVVKFGVSTLKFLVDLLIIPVGLFLVCIGAVLEAVEWIAC